VKLADGSVILSSLGLFGEGVMDEVCDSGWWGADAVIWVMRCGFSSGR
jgi:hypothetical protein